MMADPVDRLLTMAASNPSALAVDTPGAVVTYGELERMVRRIAFAIRETECAEGQHRVLIHLPMCAEAYAAMFATLMVGGFYAPTNLDHPPARRQALCRAFEPTVIIGNSHTVIETELSKLMPIIDTDNLGDHELSEPLEANDLAYVMFTSGSTGEPKGVMIGREGLAHYIDWAITAMAVTTEDRWSQHPNIGFDLSVLDIYGALCGGATLVPIIDRRERLLPAEAIRRRGMTIWNSVPSVIDLMVRARQVTQENLASLRLMTFCGEPLLKGHLDAIFAARPDVQVHNTYGPTEATVSMTLLQLNSKSYADYCDKSVAIGEAIPGMSLFLDNDTNTLNEGEVVIAGPQVARGYWRNPELTARHFGRREINGIDLPVYLTGDWAERRNGNVFFKSRQDRQVKLYGHRLELVEIDEALRRSGAIMACTILVENYLVAFVEIPSTMTENLLLTHASKILPSYAMPSKIETMKKLPRNANDKVDTVLLSRLARDIFKRSKS